MKNPYRLLTREYPNPYDIYMGRPYDIHIGLVGTYATLHAAMAEVRHLLTENPAGRTLDLYYQDELLIEIRREG